MQNSHLTLGPIMVFITVVYVLLNKKKIFQFYRKILIKKAEERRGKSTIHHNIGMIYQKDKCTLALDRFNQFTAWEFNTLKASLNALPQDRYFMIRRDIIIDVSLVNKVIREKGRLTLILNAPFTDRLLVSKKRSAKFRAFVQKNNMPCWNPARKTFCE
ncbi:MAG: hypothetical protein EOO92_12525 [Pedobacter sp.]|nr:MAG: hypothetical protein EOO92_12525 [Pedobacter sp.]